MICQFPFPHYYRPLKMYGVDFAYADSRITKTVVRVTKTDEPVFIHMVHGSGICTVSMLKDMTVGKTFDIHLDDLNLEPVKLGYINAAGQASYMMRIPVRRGPNNQGLRQENSTCANGRRLFTQPMDAVRNCIMNKYPSYKKALEGTRRTPNKLPKCIAFSRHWAICDNDLFYKNHLRVGSINGNGKPELTERFMYLKEALEESL